MYQSGLEDGRKSIMSFSHLVRVRFEQLGVEQAEASAASAFCGTWGASAISQVFRDAAQEEKTEASSTRRVGS